MSDSPGFIWQDPPPDGRGKSGPTQGAHAQLHTCLAELLLHPGQWAPCLAELLLHPGQWARMHRYASPHSASGARRRLIKQGWARSYEFTTRGGDLYGRYIGEES